jgi:S1-C subfamily serine protease
MPRSGGQRSGARVSPRGVLVRFSREIADLTGRVLRATVAVSGSTSDGGSSGSGFFIDTRGHIVTNHHVISDVQPPITITLNGGAKALAGIVGVDRIADIAVLTLDGKWPHALPLRRSRVRTGEMCLAVGNPLGRYPESVTIGVVSGLARTASAGPGRPHYDLLQTDCDIHEGNSGGPLVDVHGRVIGITTLLDTESPYIGLAIPSETVRTIVPQLLGAGRVERATLGISVAKRTLVAAGREVTGLEVVRLLRQRGQALKAGDVIVSVARQPVPDPPALFALLGGDRIGRATPVEVLRAGRRVSVTVTPWRLEP